MLRLRQFCKRKDWGQSAHSACPRWSDCFCFSVNKQKGCGLLVWQLETAAQPTLLLGVENIAHYQRAAEHDSNKPGISAARAAAWTHRIKFTVHLWNIISFLAITPPSVSSVWTVRASLVSSTVHKVPRNQDILVISSLWGHKGCSYLTCPSQVFVAFFEKALFFLKGQEPRTPISFCLFVFAGGCKQRVYTEICFFFG